MVAPDGIFPRIQTVRHLLGDCGPDGRVPDRDVRHRYSTGNYKKVHAITVVDRAVLGAATLLIHDKRFIQWKPTVLLALAAAAFLASNVIGKQPLARRMLEGVFSEPLHIAARGWRLINTLWAAWFDCWRRSISGWHAVFRNTSG